MAPPAHSLALLAAKLLADPVTCGLHPTPPLLHPEPLCTGLLSGCRATPGRYCLPSVPLLSLFSAHPSWLCDPGLCSGHLCGVLSKDCCSSGLTACSPRAPVPAHGRPRYAGGPPLSPNGRCMSESLRVRLRPGSFPVALPAPFVFPAPVTSPPAPIPRPPHAQALVSSSPCGLSTAHQPPYLPPAPDIAHCSALPVSATLALHLRTSSLSFHCHVWGEETSSLCDGFAVCKRQFKPAFQLNG